jgi:putative PIN family toxin of toxin-antitoxin system
MIVVLDTNVLVSALQFSRSQGIPAQAVTKAMTRDLIAFADAMRSETLRILVDKFRWDESRAVETLDAILEFGMLVNLEGKLHLCRDPKDDMFLECAVVSGATLVISGDRDLLSLGSVQGTLIITPAQYVKDEF